MAEARSDALSVLASSPRASWDPNHGALPIDCTSTPEAQRMMQGEGRKYKGQCHGSQAFEDSSVQKGV